MVVYDVISKIMVNIFVIIIALRREGRRSNDGTEGFKQEKFYFMV